MKRCPRCSQTFSNDMAFCLSDGTPLVSAYEEPEEATVVRKTRSGASAAGPGVSTLVKFAIAGLFLLFFLIVAGAAVLWIVWQRDDVITAENGTPKNVSSLTSPTATTTPAGTPTVEKSATPGLADERANLQSQQEALERERQRLAEERRKLEEQRKKAEEANRPQTPTFVDPGTTRITFRRGSIGETVSGTIGSARTFVLRTLGGQYLTASVRSAGGCVVFSGGSASTGFTTGYGDTYLYLRNTCGSPSRFSMTVVVR